MKKYLSIFSENERWAFIKLLSGGLRIGVSTRLTKLSLIHNTTIEISEIEQIWHGVVPPYNKLFNWIYSNEFNYLYLYRSIQIPNSIQYFKRIFTDFHEGLF